MQVQTGKRRVREIYDVGEGLILEVATDRISAFDVILKIALRIRARCSRSCPVSGLSIQRMSCRTAQSARIRRTCRNISARPEFERRSMLCEAHNVAD